MCPTCEPFSARFRLIRSFDYRLLVRQAKTLVDDGVLRLLPGSAPFDHGSMPRPNGDVHRISCAECSQHFRLVREAYGSAGMWEQVNTEATV
jgi:hypothetical protein